VSTAVAYFSHASSPGFNPRAETPSAISVRAAIHRHPLPGRRLGSFRKNLSLPLRPAPIASAPAGSPPRLPTSNWVRFAKSRLHFALDLDFIGPARYPHPGSPVADRVRFAKTSRFTCARLRFHRHPPGTTPQPRQPPCLQLGSFRKRRGDAPLVWRASGIHPLLLVTSLLCNKRDISLTTDI
jgi:hypothetical protein